MIQYEIEVKKAVKKGMLPKEIFARFNNAFIALETTRDLGLFDIKKLTTIKTRIDNKSLERTSATGHFFS